MPYRGRSTASARGSSRLAVAAAAMLALLALVAIASRGGSPSDTGGAARSPSAAFWDYLYTGTIVLMGLGVALFVFTLAWGREGIVEARRSRGNQALAGILFFLVVIGVIAGVRMLRGEGLSLQRPPIATPPATTKPGLSAKRERERHQPEFQWAPVVVLGSAAVATAAFFVVRRLRRRRRDGEPDDAALTDDLALVVDDSLADLLAEPDPRRAVIAAYARMERSLAIHGIARDGAEAPLEYLDRASRALHGRHPAARRLLFELTHLFERAKFGAHAVDRTMKDDAIETLIALRAELRGGAA